MMSHEDVCVSQAGATCLLCPGMRSLLGLETFHVETTKPPYEPGRAGHPCWPKDQQLQMP